MKIQWNKKYNTISVYTFITFCVCTVFYLCVANLSLVTTHFSKATAILQPFVYGFALAYILNFVLKFYEDMVSFRFKRLSPKRLRLIGLILTYISFFFVLYLFMKVVFPQLAESVLGLVNDIPSYLTKTGNYLYNWITHADIDPMINRKLIEQWDRFVSFLMKFMTNIIPLFAATLKVVAASIWNIVIGVIVSIYLLSDKERFFGITKKIIYATFNKQKTYKIMELTARTNTIFGRFIVGKLLDSLIIGILTFIILSIVKMPYVILISVIIGITNVIPFFGPFIGAIPSILIVLFVSPIQALWLMIIIFIIQQLDGNIIGPKILGDSIGISAFWILFSLIIAGKFLGITGMVIGVPLFAVIYSIVKDLVEAKLAKKGLPIKTEDYIKPVEYNFDDSDDE